MADDPPETNETGPGPGANPVSAQMIVALAFYLVVITGLLLWGIYRNWPACNAICVTQGTPNESPSPSSTATPTATTQTSPTSSPTPSPTSSPTPSTKPSTPPPPTQPTTSSTPTIAIESVSPKTGPMDCNVRVVIKGTGFKQGASVIFGGVPAPVSVVDPNGQSIKVQPPTHSDGEVDLVVNNPDGASSNISKYTYACPTTSETDLFLLVVFAGALGGTLHSLRSLYWYGGHRCLLKSWTLMYVLLPFTGATMAVVFYVIIGAGLLPVQTTKNISLVVIAIAVLVGLFSQQAAVKLKDIAEAFFAKPAPGPPTESRPQGSVPPGSSPETKPGTAKSAISPTSGKAGEEVKITGTGMTTISLIAFDGVEAKIKGVAADGTITVEAPQQAAGKTGPVEVVVKGDKGTVKLSFTYKPSAGG